MALDDAANFAKAIVTSGYDSAATSIAVSSPFSNAASTFPAPPFNAVWWNWTDFPDPSDDPLAEIVRVLTVSVNVFPSITRAQEGTSAQNHNTGGKVYKIAAGPTAALVDDIQSIVNVVSAAHTSLVSDVGRISVALSGTQSDVARISVALSGAISDIAKISTAHVSLVSDVARISTNHVSLVSDVGRISVALSGTQSDVARISVALSGAVSDIAKISTAHVSLVSDVARISVALSGAVSSINVVSAAGAATSVYLDKAIRSEFDGGLASTASVVIDWANGGAQHFDVSGVPSFATPTNVSAGRRYILRLSQGTSAAHSANWATAFVWPGGTPPSLGGSSAVDLLAFYADAAGNLLGSYGATGGGGSVTSAEYGSLVDRVSANSAQMTSADNAISQAVSVLAAGIASLAFNFASADGALQSQITVNSAQMTSADAANLSHINAVSNDLSALNAEFVSFGTDQVSFNDAMTSGVAAISVALSGTRSDVARISVALSGTASDVARISLAFSAAATSIMSAVSVESAERAAADISINDRVSAVSTLAAAGLISMGPVRKVLAGAQVITATAPTSVSGFTFAVSAGVAYILEFGFFHSAPVSGGGLKLILSTPTGAVWGDYQIKITPPGGTSTFSIQATNVTLAAVTVSALGVQGITHFRGVYRCSVAGTVGMACGNGISAGAAGSAVTLMAGSFGYVWRQG